MYGCHKFYFTLLYFTIISPWGECRRLSHLSLRLRWVCVPNGLYKDKIAVVWWCRGELDFVIDKLVVWLPSGATLVPEVRDD